MFKRKRVGLVLLAQELKEEEKRPRVPPKNMPVLICANGRGALSNLDLKLWIIFREMAGNYDEERAFS